MKAATLNLTINRGITFGPLLITCKDGAGTVVNITGWMPFALVKKRPGDDQPVVLDLAPTVTDGPGGVITIGKTDEQTFTMTPGSFVWDLILQAPDGTRLGPYLKGKFTISTLVTQPPES